MRSFAVLWDGLVSIWLTAIGILSEWIHFFYIWFCSWEQPCCYIVCLWRILWLVKTRGHNRGQIAKSLKISSCSEIYYGSNKNDWNIFVYIRWNGYKILHWTQHWKPGLNRCINESSALNCSLLLSCTKSLHSYFTFI